MGLSRLAPLMAENIIFLLFFYSFPSDAFHDYFSENEDYERRFYSNAYDLYPGSGYRRQFEEIASARQSSSIARGPSNNAKARRPNTALPIMDRKSRVAGEEKIQSQFGISLMTFFSFIFFHILYLVPGDVSRCLPRKIKYLNW